MSGRRSDPAGTTYQAGSLTSRAAAHRRGRCRRGQLHRHRIAVGLGTVAAGTTRTITFQVKID
jgi:hypothetical protein